MNQIGNSYIQIDNYQFDKNKILGSGGYATVFLGYYARGKCSDSQNENKLFAIKEISINSDFEISNSLIREINVLRHLKNRHIISFIDAKKTDHHFYLIMEYCSEGSLEDLVRTKHLQESQILIYFNQIVVALEYLYSKKIFHRDIKPKNILLHNGEIKLVDFGLSKIIADQNINATQGLNTCVGTPQYMAPEMLRGIGWSEESDIWSLGLTLYFMIFKDLPWDQNSISSLHILEQIEEKFAKAQEQIILPDSPSHLPIQTEPHKQRLKNLEELRYLFPKDISEKESRQISISTLRLLDSMLQIDQDKRLKWKQLFSIPSVHEYLNQFSLNQIDNINQFKQRPFQYEITPETLIVTQDESGENQEELQRHGALWNEQIDSMKKQKQLAWKAKELIEFEQEKAKFFDKVYILLKDQYINDPSLIPKDLYVKCKFLLFKRSNIILSDLSKMMAFRLHSQGSVSIEEHLWKAFEDNWDQPLCENIMKENTYFEKKFSNCQVELNSVYKKLEKFEMIQRGDAYSQQLEENSNLIQAFNDNFLQLFQILAERAFALRKENKLIGKKNKEVHLLQLQGLYRFEGTSEQ